MTTACGCKGGFLREDGDVASGSVGGKDERMGSLRRAVENGQIRGTFAFAFVWFLLLKSSLALRFGDSSEKHPKC